MSNHTTEATRLDFLDGVRGLAALSVVWSHFTNGFGKHRFFQQIFQYTPVHTIWDGFAAVSMFFVLSGMVLSIKHFSVVRSEPLSMSITAFYIKRIFRISVPFAAIVILSFVIQTYLYVKVTSHPAASAWLYGFWDHPEPIREAAMLLKPPKAKLVPQGWTLSTELIMSFLTPMLILTAKRSIIWMAFICFVFVSLLHVSVFIFHFGLGIAISANFHRITTWVSSMRNSAKCALLVIGIALYSYRYTLPHYFPEHLDHFHIWEITGIGAFVLLCLCIGSRRIQKALDSHVLRFLGKVSYSLYLVHIIVLVAIVPRLLVVANQFGVGGDGAYALALLLATALSLMLATASYFLIEKPSMWLGRRVSVAVAINMQRLLAGEHR